MVNLNAALRTHLIALSEPRNPVEHLEAHQKARLYLQKQLQSQNREVETLHFSTLDHPLGGINFYAPGIASNFRALLVAHYDTVAQSPGADDNGSAVAVALEVCRRCPQLSGLFCDLEERGLLGSRHFAQNQREDWDIVVVLDSVGYTDTTPGSQSYPGILPAVFPDAFQAIRERESKGDFWALLHLESQRAEADSLRQHLDDPNIALGLPDNIFSAEVSPELYDFGRSDHLAFWERGIPCLMLTDTANFRNPNYHQPSDTIDTLDFPAMERLVKSLTNYFKST